MHAGFLLLSVLCDTVGVCLLCLVPADSTVADKPEDEATSNLGAAVMNSDGCLEVGFCNKCSLTDESQATTPVPETGSHDVGAIGSALTALLASTPGVTTSSASEQLRDFLTLLNRKEPWNLTTTGSDIASALQLSTSKLDDTDKVNFFVILCSAVMG